MNAAQKFLDLVERSVIVQGAAMIALTGTIIYLAVVKQPIPDLLRDLTLLTYGFYFGGKIENAKSRLVTK